jgi:histone acetyltransferase (RNA polymerase elongator complex component)
MVMFLKLSTVWSYTPNKDKEKEKKLKKQTKSKPVLLTEFMISIKLMIAFKKCKDTIKIPESLQFKLAQLNQNL